MSPPPDLRGAAPPREALLMHTLCFNPGCSPRKSTGLRELGGGLRWEDGSLCDRGLRRETARGVGEVSRHRELELCALGQRV